MILYYTGTGNSRYAASILSQQSGKELVCMNDIMRQRIQDPYAAKYSFKSDSSFVIVCPTYCWRIPRVVEKFIRESRFEGTKKIYFYLTCGTGTGAAYTHAQELCHELELDFMGLGSVKMPENFITMFKAPSYDEAHGIIRAAISQIESAGRLIHFGKTISDNNAGSPNLTKLNNLFYKIFVNDKKFSADDNCISCGKCENICPLCNISLEDGKPQWHGNCTQCMACIAICPQEAIEFGNKAKGKRRYYLYANGTQKNIVRSENSK